MSHHFVEVWDRTSAWQHVSLILLAFAALVQIMFVAEYASRPWVRDPVGRAIMLKSFTLLLLLVLSLVNTFFTYPAQEIVSVILVAFLVCAITYQFIVLYTSPEHPAWPRDTPDDDSMLDRPLDPR